MASYEMFTLVLGLSVGLFWSCGSTAPLPTVDSVDLERYQGKWYEITKLPNRFERGLKCVSAEYTLREDGDITVVNRGVKIKDGSVKDIEGKAYVPDPEKTAQLKVSFFWPFAGDYYIIDLADDYAYAMVGDPSRKFLWILAREKKLDKSITEALKEKASDLGFNVSLMEDMTHDCNED